MAEANQAYCPTCRRHFVVPWDSPPYSVLHVSDSEHLHPVTRERVTPDD